MLLVKIACNEEQNFIEDIHGIKEILKKKDIKIGVSEFMENETHFIKIFCDDESQNIEEVRSKVLLYIANAIYRAIIDKYRNKELLEYLTENYFFLKHEEIMEVDKKIKAVLKEEVSITSERHLQCINNITKIENIINEFIREDSFINIEGFIRFRLKPIRPIIEDIIDKVVEDYMVEKEYNEFINLLKYFVDIQDSKLDVVNIYIKEDGHYSIKDIEGKDLFKIFVNELVESKDATNINSEDVIISGLITNAPKCIHIYGREFCIHEEFLKTITSVFRERVDFVENKNIL
ncbi:putative sporulation protein YtxC [uncultured Clostridium sp.]|uniref:putative sporulation protein YtxC n=1 Tax=uncultured Clostridium sp. TaxID=59620 RepID=UPI0026385A13|nr:putative sporulation protein YtxC [uncultured Clostridium sp.]